METIPTIPIDYKTLYKNILVSLQTINALYIELHKKVMEVNPEIILNNQINLYLSNLNFKKISSNNI